MSGRGSELSRSSSAGFDPAPHLHFALKTGELFLVREIGHFLTSRARGRAHRVGPPEAQTSPSPASRRGLPVTPPFSQKGGRYRRGKEPPRYKRYQIVGTRHPPDTEAN